jgi:hypothetical protein
MMAKNKERSHTVKYRKKFTQKFPIPNMCKQQRRQAGRQAKIRH